MTETTPASVARTAERGIRHAIIAVFVVGLRQRNAGAVVNAAVALVATYLPEIIERRYDAEFRPWQRVYADTAMFTHAFGMLGPYDNTWWWDRLTHTHSATLLAGIVYVVARRHGRDPTPRVLAAIVGGGVLWELLEYTVHAVTDRLGLDPVLIPYSARDTAFDLLTNLFGALLVLLFGDRLLDNFVR